MRTPMVGLLLLAAAFAGCSDDSSGSDSAMSGLDKANARAEAWNAEAALVGIVGVEAGQELISDVRQEEDLPEEFEAAIPRSDGDVGDGRAPAWMYVYSHEDHLYLVIVSGGKVTFADSNFTDELVEDLGHDELEPVGDFEIDSDEAADIAAEADDNFTGAGAGGQGFAFYSLGRTGGQVIWTLTVGSESEDGETFAVVQVAADTGEVLSSGGDDLISLPEEILQEAGSFDETATAVEAGSVQFAIGDGHATMNLRAYAEEMPPLATLTFTVVDPDGEEHVLDLTNDGTGFLTGYSVVGVSGPPEGQWSVTVELTQGASQDFNFQFCTDGMPNEASVANEACAS